MLEVERHQRNDEGLTAREWAEKLGWSLAKASAVLTTLGRENKLLAGWRWQTDITGRRNKVPVYRLKR